MRDSKLGKEIFLFMLLITVTVSAAIFAVAYLDMVSLRDNSKQFSQELGEASAEVAEEGIISEANSTMMHVAVDKAENHNSEFGNVQRQLKQMCDIMYHKYIFSELDYGYVPPYPLDTEDGVLMGRSAVASRVEIDDSIVKEQMVVSTLEPLIKTIYENNTIIMNVMVGTKSGIFYRYSDYNRFDEDYDVNTRGWYLNAMDNPGKVVWSDAYEDAYGKLVVTASCAYMDDSGEYVGVIASDIMIQTIIDSVLMYDKVADGYSFLLNRDGKYLAYPGMNNDDFEMDPQSDSDPVKKQIVLQMIKGGTGKASFSKEGKRMLIFYAPITTTGWSYALVVPLEGLTAPVQNATAVIDEGTSNVLARIDDAIREMLAAFILIFILILIIIISASYRLTSFITNPISEMLEGTLEIGKGNLDHVIDVKGNNELSALGDSINKMAVDLKSYIEELTEVTAEKQRMGAELNVATSIQSGMLPKIFPKFSSSEYYSLSASMCPAKEVGGDFYDFFMVDDNHLAMVIADVSGKGVPAALFMVIAKTLIKSRALAGGSVSEILESVNNQLCESNDNDMFVTVLLGIIDIKTGQMEYANAGHEYPIIKRKGGEYYANTEKHSFVMGGMEGMKYKQFSVTLNEGDTIFTYTDGIPEAHNIDNEMYGMERTINTLNMHKDAEPDEVLQILRDDVDAFTGDAPQFDDITMLCYKQLRTD